MSDSHGGLHEEEHAGHDERWLVSYADFITLLMVLFVVLYSMGQVDVEKYKQLADSMRAAFSLGGPAQVIDAGINSSGGSVEDGQPNPIVIPGIPMRPPQSEEVAGELTYMLASQNLGGEVSVQTNVEGVLISLSEKLIFDPGTAQLQADAYPVLDTIVEMVRPIENQVRVVGHTDNTAPTDPRFHNNWELSTGRASVIAEYMISKGIAPTRITISGRGEYEPIFPNDSEEHRALNSRADIVIIYRVASNHVGLETNHLDTSSTAAE
ncbi:MAG: OmpA family protein [Chloroflexi bacterium]|nr:OmpA family protein [Chloroflexota bacterium]